MRNKIIYQIIDLASDLRDCGVDIEVLIGFRKWSWRNTSDLEVRLIHWNDEKPVSYYMRENHPNWATRYSQADILQTLEQIKAEIIDDAREAA